MIFVDTSVWLGFFRGDAEIGRALGDLLDEDRVALAAPVRVELLGHVGRRRHALLADLLSALPTYRTTDATWDTMEKWAEAAVRRGARFGVADLMIAAVASEHGCRLWSLDSDFGRMAALGFVALHR
jgi:predicted nucleic acid-binding protein